MPSASAGYQPAGAAFVSPPKSLGVCRASIVDYPSLSVKSGRELYRPSKRVRLQAKEDNQP
jgi:hypothetical protein